MKKTTKQFLSWIMVLTIFFTSTFLTVGAQETDPAEVGAEAEIAETGADDYPYRGQTSSVADKWNFYSLNCTSFCAWRLNNNNGVAFHNHYGNVHWGNAKNWDDAARQIGIAVNSTPAVGAIAYWNREPYGHVAWVAQVNANGTVTIEEYNYPNKYKYNSRTISASNPDGYIHIKDILPNPIPDPTTPPVPPKNDHDPIGHLDGVQGGKGCFQIWGYSFDPDSSSANMVHVYGNAPAGDPNAVFLGGFFVDMIDRPDVCQAYPQCQGSKHGYHAELKADPSITRLYLYSINIQGTAGENKMFCETAVNIQQPDSTHPEFKSCKIASSERTTYRISAVPMDDTQVDKVVCATWTLNNNMSDIRWQDMCRLSNGEYILDIKRADFMASKNSVYVNDVYLYYKNSQEKCVRLIQDYRLSEKSAKLFADGDYRIISAVDQNMGLDITGASKESGANVQLYKNTSDKTQVFRLSYTDEGYYKIKNTNSGKLIDVLFDTYQPNTTVSQSDDNGGDNQKWLIYAVENNKFCIKARSNGLALSVADGKAINSTDVRVETYKGINSQHFYIKRVLTDDMVSVKDVSYQKGDTLPSPEISVTVDGKHLTEGSDYLVDISSTGGKGTVTVNGIGDFYCDSVTKEFTITTIEPATQAPTQSSTQNPTQAPTQAPTQVNDETGKPSLSLSNAEVLPDDTFSIALSLDKNSGITAMSVQIDYPDVFSLVDVEYKDLFSSKASGGKKTANPYILSWYSTACEDEHENGVLAVLTFKVNDNAELGDYSIKLRYDSDNIFNENMANVPFTTSNATVKLHDHIPGDVNQDGAVNMKDVVMAQKYVNGETEGINGRFVDADGDSKTTMRDVILILKKHNGEDVTLK